MGIPYSKQIHAAFDQVTPLVGASYRVLETTKDIAILLAAVQVLIAILFALILIALIGLLITTNPDLEHERQSLVTPTIKWLCAHRVFVGMLATLTPVIVFMLWFAYGHVLNKNEYEQLSKAEEEQMENDIADEDEDAKGADAEGDNGKKSDQDKKAK